MVFDDATPDSALLTVAAGERHDGTEGSGARIVRSGASALILDTRGTNSVRWLEIDGNAQTVDVGVKHDTGGPNTLSRMLVHGGDGDATTCVAVWLSDAGNLLNCILYDWSVDAGSARHAYGVNEDTGGAWNVSNCTIHDIEANSASGNAYCLNLGDQANGTLQNLIATDPGGSSSGTQECYSISSYSNATCDHNLASDTSASGTGSLDSKVAANQFVSVVGGSEDLHLKAGADAIDAGTDLVTTPTGVNIDIDGSDRDGLAVTWDMGAHELIADVGNPWNYYAQAS